MAEYLSPGVYVEDIASAAVIEQVSSSTGAFAGIAQRGKVGVPALVTSWNAYLNKYAGGLSTPFMDNSDLAYAVYGFFQNGGQRCYIQRVAGEDAAVATCVLGETDFPSAGAGEGDYPEITAKDEGVWGNGLKVDIATDENVSGAFKITVSLNGVVQEVFTELTNTPNSNNYWVDIINMQSNFISAVSGTIKATTQTITFTGGDDDVDGVSDQSYIDCLANFDAFDDFTLLALPGQTSNTVYDAIFSYCENRKYVFAIIDPPRASTVESIKTLRASLSCSNAAIYFPYIRVNDPLSTTGKLRDCPPSGHIMGVYARTITERGVWKAPAGTEAVVRGAIETVVQVTKGDTDILNPAYINSIMAKTNYGIVVWGARCLNPDSSMKYVSDMLLDINIKKSVEQGTQVYVFEPNAHETWAKVRTTVQTFLDGLWRDGALYGETAAEAYYVICDDTINTETERTQGKMICEVGYASKKPAEFVIFRFSHNVAAANS